MDPKVNKLREGFQQTWGAKLRPDGGKGLTPKEKLDLAADKLKIEQASSKTMSFQRASVAAGQKQVDRIMQEKTPLVRIERDVPNKQLDLFIDRKYLGKQPDYSGRTAKDINERVGIKHVPGRYLIPETHPPTTDQIQGRLTSRKPYGQPDAGNPNYPPGNGNGVEQVKIRPNHWVGVKSYTPVGGQQKYQPAQAAVAPAPQKPLVTAKPPATAPPPPTAKPVAVARTASPVTARSSSQAANQAAPTPAAMPSGTAGRGAANSPSGRGGAASSAASSSASAAAGSAASGASPGGSSGPGGTK